MMKEYQIMENLHNHDQGCFRSNCFLTTIDFRPQISRVNVYFTRESIENTRETSPNFPPTVLPTHKKFKTRFSFRKFQHSQAISVFLNYYDSRKSHFRKKSRNSRNSTKIFHVVCKMKSKEFYGFYYITLSELKERVIQTFIIKLITTLDINFAKKMMQMNFMGIMRILKIFEWIPIDSKFN